MPKPLKLYLGLLLVLTALPPLYSLAGRMLGWPRMVASPYSMVGIGSDFTEFWELFQHVHTTGLFQDLGMQSYMYPAPAIFLYKGLYAVWGTPSHLVWPMWGFITAAVATATCLFYRALRTRGMGARPAAVLCGLTVILSYPLQFEYLRGNVEIMLWVLVLLAIYALHREWVWAAGCAIGLAGAVKIYPLLLLGLCLTRRRWKAVPLALAVFAGVTVASEAWLGPTFAAAHQGIRTGVERFLNVFALTRVANEADHSIFGLVKYVANLLHELEIVHHFSAPAALKVYMLVAGLSFLALYFGRLRRMPQLNQAVVLITCTLLLPPVSFDYTLLHAYIAWGLFTLYLVERGRRGKKVPFATAVMVLYALTCSPYGYRALDQFQYGAQMRCVAMVGVIGIFLWQPYPESDGDPA